MSKIEGTKQEVIINRNIGLTVEQYEAVKKLAQKHDRCFGNMLRVLVQEAIDVENK